MGIILTKVVLTSGYEEDKPDVPQLAAYIHLTTLYLPAGTSLTARLRLIREYTRRYKLHSIGRRACYANYTKK